MNQAFTGLKLTNHFRSMITFIQTSCDACWLSFSRFMFCLAIVLSFSGCTVWEIDPDFAVQSSKIRQDCQGKEIVGVWVTRSTSRSNHLGPYLDGTVGANKYVLMIKADGTAILKTIGPGGNYEAKGGWSYSGNGVWKFGDKAMGESEASVYWTGDKLLFDSKVGPAWNGATSVTKQVYLPWNGDDDA